MKTNDELETELEELKKEFYFFTKNNTSSGNTKPTTPSKPSTSTDEDWTLLFDMESEEPTINLGYTTGIHGTSGVITSLPDLVSYNKLKIVYHHPMCLEHYEFDISDKRIDNELRILQQDGYMLALYAANMCVKFDSAGKYVFWVGGMYTMNFYTSGNKIPTITNNKNNEYVYIAKILAK